MKKLLLLFITFLSIASFAQQGTTCDQAITVMLPFTTTDFTGNYGDDTSNWQGNLCGAIPPSTNYLSGNDVFYTYQATFTGLVRINMSPQPGQPNSSVFVYSGCADVGNSCIAGSANTGVNLRTFTFNVTEGNSYIIVISSTTATPTVNYTLNIQREACTPVFTDPASLSTTTNSVQITWNSPGDYTVWQTALLPAASAEPGEGSTVFSNTFSAGGLTPGTQYKLWVRAACPEVPGLFSAWKAFPFTTTLCADEDKCAYMFKLTDSGANGWQGATMQVRQNGLTVATLGSTFTSGAGPVNVSVLLCDEQPFELYWSNGGVFYYQCGIEIYNPFAQKIYTLQPGGGVVPTVLFTSNVNCSSPVCQVTPANVSVQSASTTTSGFNITWNTALLSVFDIYIVPAGADAPTAETTPTYNDISVANPSSPSFQTTIPLIPDTAYDIYVRTVCDLPTQWAKTTAVTQVSCLPTSAANVSLVTHNSAQISWTKGKPSDNEWEVLLVPSLNLTADYIPQIADGILFNASTTPSFIASGLSAGTSYFVFVRTVCGPDDKSRWSARWEFITSLCAETDKCQYKFVLTDTAGNGWNNGKMIVRQNGILISELTMPTGSSLTKSVDLCANVPFDIFWSLQGSVPAQIGVSVFDPNNDLLYSLAPGSSTAYQTVLYNGVTNCVLPSCQKPENMTTGLKTSATAVLIWDSMSTLSDLYVTVAGAPAPVNSPSTAPTHTDVTSPYTLTSLNGNPLTPATAYTFYVRANCAWQPAMSTWTATTPVTFITTPANDDYTGAINVVPSPAQSCSMDSLVHATTAGATASAVVTTGTGCSGTDDDVWFSFTATSTSHSIRFLNIQTSGVSTTLYHTLFSTTAENTLLKMYCQTGLTSLATALTIGQTYYLRVYSGATANFATFDLCISSPPVNDEFVNAIDVPVNPSLAILNSISGSTAGATDQGFSYGGTGCGISDDDIWYRFVAASTSHIIAFGNIQNTGVPPGTLNHSVFSGNLVDGLTKLMCAITAESVLTGLTVGQTYYIRVYSSLASIQSPISFTVAVTTPTPITNDECSTAILLEGNSGGVCNVSTPASLTGATASATTTGCTGTADDDVWFKFVAESNAQIISLENVLGSATVVMGLYSGTCDNMTLIVCNSTKTISRNDFVPGATYYLRIWSSLSTPQAVSFNVCLKTISSCQNAEPFCGSGPDDPYVFPSVTGSPNNTQVACLGTIPNPVYYTMRVDESGALQFQILQNSSFDTYGNPTGVNLDVDFTAWGPFATQQACDQILFADCPTCPNNTSNTDFYPFGNIVDCSYDASYVETLTIENALEGQYYIILLTNFSDDPAKIKLTQTNFNQPGAGTTYCADKINLVSFIDTNVNGIKDAGEVNFNFGSFKYQMNNTGPVTDASGPMGRYSLYDTNPANTYDFWYQIHPEFQAYYTITPTAFSDLNIPAGSGTQTLYFPVVPTAMAYNNVSVTIVPEISPRPGIVYKNRIIYKNLGMLPASGNISFVKDPAVTVDTGSTFVTPTTTGFTFATGAMGPFESRTLIVNTAVPNIPEVNIGDVLYHTVKFTIAATDTNPMDNIFTSAQTVIGAYDPNDKVESHGDEIELSSLAAGEYLYYTIRFQNTGTYNAFDVRVEDYLDAKLDETSIRMENASHNYTMQRTGNHVVWTFADIFLPSIVQDEPKSHGYVQFRIKPKPGYAVGDVIDNNASIYFDTNPAIITNTVSTEVANTLGSPEFGSSQVLLYPNPASTNITISLVNTNEVLKQVALYDLVGKCISTKAGINDMQTDVNVSGLSKGVYLVEITTESNAKQVRKLVIK